MREEVIEADVLCVGGGIAGLMAAIRATELGARVIVAEKGNTLRSGSGATGNDHFQCYIPEVHGTDINAVIEELPFSQIGAVTRTLHKDFLRTWLETSFDIVKLWDSWGIPMKYKGKYEFAGHTYPGCLRMYLKYAGESQKPILTKEARKRGAEIINRVTVFDLFGDDGVNGAIGAHTREDKVIIFRAKSVVLGTGGCIRLYPGPTPGWMFNLADSPSTTGDGRAMAYRAGAELAGMELLARHAGPKYFARCGQATWVGILRDQQGKPVGPFLTKPDKRYGDMTTELSKTLFEDYAKSGKGPVYMDCGGISGEDFEYMRYWLGQEGNTALLNYLKEEGIDPRNDPVEFTTYEMTVPGGICSNQKAETSARGLYVAGDESFMGISGAAIFGWIAGENAAKYAKEAKSPNIDKTRVKIEQREGLLDEISSRKIGPSWKEVNIALQQIMYDYAGPVRSESLLTAGLSHLRRLREKAHSTVIARNQHELMHCLEVLNLLDIGELVFITANERKETRGTHIRPDYPFTNPLLDKSLIIKKIDETPVTNWSEIIH